MRVLVESKVTLPGSDNDRTVYYNIFDIIDYLKKGKILLAFYLETVEIGDKCT